ncbi:50S ribosomal protein L3 [Patescibacteria group bacterium]|nr:50S ribosomal protein L3 [Patescibacteria group bacterium]MBU4367878.1 50S ribosomal protein L3 [Patescibacteria group bacterium]MBU4461945.1 50S ribosomal protein L3 [Patescibacteria group bacterium]MCG2699888.1 50S ribosomal protein L3 [Candidatus Parcubacteria bacterium]
MKFIIGKKIGMSQFFSQGGVLIPVTLIEAGPCYVLQQKTKEKDGYQAFQVGFDKITKEKKIKKSAKGKEYRYIREERVKDDEQNKVGDKIDLSLFKEGDIVAISGISKGKGFQGSVKRWGFAGKSSSHGVKHEHRTLGSIGSRFPQRVVPGKKMPGRMGGERTTVKNLKIVKTDIDNNLLIVKGAVPGRKGTLLEIRSGT